MGKFLLFYHRSICNKSKIFSRCLISIWMRFFVIYFLKKIIFVYWQNNSGYSNYARSKCNSSKKSVWVLLAFVKRRVHLKYRVSFSIIFCYQKVFFYINNSNKEFMRFFDISGLNYDVKITSSRRWNILWLQPYLSKGLGWLSSVGFGLDHFWGNFWRT